MSTELNLPQTIRSFFDAKAATDAGAASACFADDATVFDNGEDTEIRGATNISTWLAATVGKYKMTSEVRSCEEQEGAYLVGVVVSGDFPGSPYEFAYRFKLSGEKILELAIDPVGPP